MSDMFGLFGRQFPSSTVCSHMHPLDTRGGNVSAATNNLYQQGKTQVKVDAIRQHFIFPFLSTNWFAQIYMKNIFRFANASFLNVIIF